MLKPIEAGCLALVIRGVNSGRVVRCHANGTQDQVVVIHGSKYLTSGLNWWLCEDESGLLQCWNHERNEPEQLQVVEVRQDLLMRLDGLTDSEQAEIIEFTY